LRRRRPRGLRADVDPLEAICTSAFAWVLTRPPIEPLYRSVVIPALGAFGLMFGLWYTGIT